MCSVDTNCLRLRNGNCGKNSRLTTTKCVADSVHRIYRADGIDIDSVQPLSYFTNVLVPETTSTARDAPTSN